MEKLKPPPIIRHLEKFVVAGRIPKWWLPDVAIFVQQLPLTGTGKIDKKVLKEGVLR